MAIVDGNGTPVANAITWMDSRARSEATELELLLGNEYIYHMSGWRIFPTLDAAKILHLHRLGLEKPGDKYLSTIEIVNQYLTGHAVIDPTSAAIRQLMDIRTGRWDPRMLEALGITPDQLPEIIPTGALVGGLTQSCRAGTLVSRKVLPCIMVHTTSIAPPSVPPQSARTICFSPPERLG